MEESKEYKQENLFIKKYMKEVDLESPSTNFTSNIMDVLLEEDTKKVITSKPLISKKIWFAVASFVVLCLYFVLKNSAPSSITLSPFEFNFLEEIQIPNVFESLSVSNAIVYASALFTLMVFIQIYFLKGYFEKRMN